MGDRQYTERGANMANEQEFPIVFDAVKAAYRAFDSSTDLNRPVLLRAIATAADAARAEITATVADESALTPDELAPEFDRMTGTLRMFADLIEEGSWVRAAIDTKVFSETSPTRQRGSDPTLPASLIGPNHDLRSMLVPLGPVA